MPFFETLLPEETVAVYELGRLAWLELYERAMGYPALDGGVTDYWAKVIPMLRDDPELMDRVFDRRAVTIEERTVSLPLAGTVELSIVRIEQGSGVRMDDLEYAARLSECLVGIPLPSQQLMVLIRPGVDTFAYKHPAYVAMDTQLDQEGEGLRSLLVHEVAHDYWWEQPWIAEGAASFTEFVNSHVQTLRPLHWKQHLCPNVDSISAYDRAHKEWQESEEGSPYGCSYAVGSGLLADLYHVLGTEEFALGFSKLYLGVMRSGYPGIDEVRESFGGSAAADLVIDLWYEGAGEFAKSRGDTTPPDPELLGDIEVGLIVVFNPTSSKAEATCDGVNVSILTRDEIAHGVNLCVAISLLGKIDPDTEAHLRSVTDEILEMMEMVVYFEDGTEALRAVPAFTAHSVIGSWQHRVVHMVPLKGEDWEPGSYYIYLYHDGKKVGQSWFHVRPSKPTPVPTATPTPELHPMPEASNPHIQNEEQTIRIEYLSPVTEDKMRADFENVQRIYNILEDLQGTPDNNMPLILIVKGGLVRIVYGLDQYERYMEEFPGGWTLELSSETFIDDELHTLAHELSHWFTYYNSPTLLPIDEGIASFAQQFTEEQFKNGIGIGDFSYREAVKGYRGRFHLDYERLRNGENIFKRNPRLISGHPTGFMFFYGLARDYGIDGEKGRAFLLELDELTRMDAPDIRAVWHDKEKMYERLKMAAERVAGEDIAGLLHLLRPGLEFNSYTSGNDPQGLRFIAENPQYFTDDVSW